MKKELSYNTKSKEEIITITDDINRLVKDSGIGFGTILMYSLHTTLSLFIQESSEPNLCQDMIDQLKKIVDDDGMKYAHRCADNPKAVCETDAVNGPSHVRNLLTNQSLVLDIEGGKLNLGTFQDVAILELDGPRKNRKVFVKVIKDGVGK